MDLKGKYFSVEEGQKVDLKKWPTAIKPFYSSKEQYKDLLARHVKQLSELQDVLYAHGRYSLLLIFQAMDAAGKDGTIKHVMSGVNPQGCEVFSFKQPGSQELKHDFLWRCNLKLPERGRIGIFNRSYYEEVLIVRVRPEVLAAQELPEELIKDKNIWQGRYASIVDLESHLYRNGTRIIKFFLHLSKVEQRKRFLQRIDEPQKNWKFSLSDVAERKLWRTYIKAYEDCLVNTTSKEAPWYIIPADDKENARIITSQIIIETLKKLHLTYPKVSVRRRREILLMRKELL